MTKALMIVAGLMITTAAWPAVTVHEEPATGQQTNYISEGGFTSGKIGEPPSKPWSYSTNAGPTRVTVETPAGRPENERWAHLVDNNDKAPANIRQSFGPVKSGRFQARVLSNKEGGRLFFNLGSGTAAKPEERAMQLSIEADGSLGVKGETKVKTAAQVKTGEVYLVRCDFEPVQDGKALRIVAELVEEKAQRPSRVETVVATQVAITTLRVTSTGPDTGVDYYVTDLSLTGR